MCLLVRICSALGTTALNGTRLHQALTIFSQKILSLYGGRPDNSIILYPFHVFRCNKCSSYIDLRIWSNIQINYYHGYIFWHQCRTISRKAKEKLFPRYLRRTKPTPTLGGGREAPELKVVLFVNSVHWHPIIANYLFLLKCSERFLGITPKYVCSLHCFFRLSVLQVYTNKYIYTFYGKYLRQSSWTSF